MFFEIYVDIGSVDLTLSAHTVAHDTCNDVWYIDGSIDADWSMNEFTFTSLTLTFTGNYYRMAIVNT